MYLINKPVLLTAAALLSGILLNACSVNPATGERDLVLMSEDQELAIGRSSHAAILKEYGAYADPKLAAYVQKVGERVAANSHRSNLIYRFTVLDSADVNAFALPGGYIYVTRGILAFLNSEAELAAVLGHEIGHVTARHAVRQQTTATLAGIAGAILSSQSGVQGVGNIANLLGTALVRGYGREHELEADRLGANYIAKTGYASDAMLGVIRVLKNQAVFETELATLEDRKPRSYHGLFSTHPDNDQRLQSILNNSRNIKPAGERLADNHRAYLQTINGMTYAQGTREGIVRGQRFYHQDMGFTVLFPADWRVKNRPGKLTATSANNDGHFELTVHDRNRRISPKQFMSERLGLKNLRDGEAFNHNGLQGYTAIASTSSAYGNRQARVIVLYYGKRAFVLSGVAKNTRAPYQYDSLFLKSGHSFRPLKGTEKQRGKARRIVIKAFHNQTYHQLARQSGLNHLAESQIRLLNGHYPTGKPTRGNLIKTIE